LQVGSSGDDLQFLSLVAEVLIGDVNPYRGARRDRKANQGAVITVFDVS
jgi:hypothetical protein